MTLLSSSSYYNDVTMFIDGVLHYMFFVTLFLSYYYYFSHNQHIIHAFHHNIQFKQKLLLNQIINFETQI